MGQTLSHGVYLPAEGERNCYSGLASNWNLLDTAIGDTAGKASATHTHGNITNDGKVGTTANLPLITGTGGAVQAGAFGNQANTFCEGNDSRLSDARTPVAHTHTKSDVTDLLNSNFIPSANNSYDLGSSSYQWNNLYAKGYYYNGVAWGLDKANEWTGDNTFSSATNSVFCFKFGTSGSYSDIRWIDNNSSHYATLRGRVNELTLGIKYSSASAWYNGASVNITNNGSVQIKAYDGTEPWTVTFTPVGVYPTSGNALDLGTSTNKWKTLNGINPGALSLPDYTLAKVDLIDFSQWSVAGQPNAYTPISDGWLLVNIKDTASNSLFIYAHGLYNADPTKATDYSASCFGNGSQGLDGRIAVMLPVRAGIVYRIYIKAASVSEIYSAKFYPALGNV